LWSQKKFRNVSDYRRLIRLEAAGKLTKHLQDFREQKARAGESSIRVSSAIARRLQDRFAELGLTMLSGLEGQNFLREKEGAGTWHEADDLDYKYHLDWVESSRLHFLYEELGADGRMRTKKKELQVSKESNGKRRPVPTMKIEVNCPPMVMQQIALKRAEMLAAGKKPDEAELFELALVQEALPVLVDYLEKRTGQKVCNAFTHYDSGFWHLGFYLTRVDQNLRQIGLPQVGVTGVVNVGWNSQLWAGYAMPAKELATSKKHMLLMRDRYAPGTPKAAAAFERGAIFDGRATDQSRSAAVRSAGQGDCRAPWSEEPAHR
jgi:hypothetical protein